MDEDKEKQEEAGGNLFCELKDLVSPACILHWTADEIYALQGADGEQNRKILEAYRLVQEAKRLLTEAGEG